MGVESTSWAWDAEAERYDQAADHGLHDPRVREAWRALLTAHLPVPPALVADLGCGTGTLSVLLAEGGFTVHGVDFSPAMLERARQKSAEAQVEVVLSQGDAAAPPLAAGRFDVVLCRHVLWAVPDPAAALRRWLELLGPVGRIVLIEGSWSTGAGLTASETGRLLRAVGREPVTRELDDPALWGGPITDHRYLTTA